VPEPPKRPPLAEAMRYAQVGTMLIAPMIVFGAIGYVLDGRWETAPWLLLAGLLLGMATGFVNFFRLVLASPGGEKDDRGGEGR
jgi:F0F1-type ATP synthase assembly protein I